VTGDAIPPPGRHVIGIRHGSGRAVCALGAVGAIVAGVTADRADRGMIHRVDGEARRRVGMAVTALNRAGRNVGRRRHERRTTAIGVAADAIGIGWLVNVAAPKPAREGRGR